MIGTRAAFARHRGVDRALVTRWVQDGKIPALPDGRIDFEAATAALAANLDPSRGGRNGWSDRTGVTVSPSASPHLTGALVMREPDRKSKAGFETPITLFRARWAKRLAKAQRRAIHEAFPAIRQSAGDEAALAKAMGDLFDQLQRILEDDSERLLGDLVDVVSEEIELIEGM